MGVEVTFINIFENKNMYLNDVKNINCIDLQTIKLIIWDLDNTFWDGILSDYDTKIDFNIQNIDLIKKLTDHGIMNSICSKNDFSSVEKQFIENKQGEVWNYFVFSSISWEAKGKRIQDIISKMQLRDENVLFIDDNKTNLEEAKYFCPNIQTALPDIIPNLIEQLQNLTTADIKHERLKRYKILEEKNIQRKFFDSNETFLYSSNIKVLIKSDCIENSERIFELIKRTNQLNYTKKRISQSELNDLLVNQDIENRYIIVSDKYGDYGICGFYSYDKKNNELIHFLFSCSILSMGVEQYVYNCLGCPKLDVIGKVSAKLVLYKNCNWINQIEGEEKRREEKRREEKRREEKRSFI